MYSQILNKISQPFLDDGFEVYFRLCQRYISTLFYFEGQAFTPSLHCQKTWQTFKCPCIFVERLELKSYIVDISMTFTPPLQHIFIEILTFTGFFSISVCFSVCNSLMQYCIYNLHPYGNNYIRRGESNSPRLGKFCVRQFR